MSQITASPPAEYPPVAPRLAPAARDPRLAALGLALVAVLAIPPLLVRPPVELVNAGFAGWLGKALVLLLMIGAVGVRIRADRGDEPWPLQINLGFVLLSGLMVVCHWFLVDACAWKPADWQREMYLDILNRRADAPHQFRPLPYGFTRLVELLTGDWQFAVLAYRWFFNYWFVWAWYRFARLFLGPVLALLTLTVLPIYYPLSIFYYWGQLTDPLSHSLFVLALIYVIEDRWLVLAAALALGMLAKETAVLIVPVYWACHWHGGWRAFGRAHALGDVCVAAFLAARLPLGWRPGNESMNGLVGLMVSTNLGLYRLGIGQVVAWTFVPLYMNYLHPLVFVLPFVPFIAWRWWRTDARLRWMFALLIPLVLASNLCFGWLYESRNYMPFLPVLTTMALPCLAPRRASTDFSTAVAAGKIETT